MSEENQKKEKPELYQLPPDLFSRNTVIAFLAKKLCSKARPAILDVGGYDGQLHEFLDDYAKFVILDRKPVPAGADGKDDQEPDSEESPQKPVYKQADATKIPFSDRNFDIVVASDMLEHIDVGERAQVVKELLRVSKNCVIIGAPFNGNMTVTAEDLIRSQYYANVGVEHPFLIEHEAMGLPEESQMDGILTEAGVKFIKVRESNLMNWFLQQLYTGTCSGEMEDFRKYGFYTFFNEHLGELGILRPPVYRTIYCILKDGSIDGDGIYGQLQEKFVWSSEVFMQLMRIAFDDLRFLINSRNESVKTLAKEVESLGANVGALREELETTLTKAKKGTLVYRQAVLELRNFLQEKEQALNFMKGIVQEKDSQLEALKSKTETQENEIRKLDDELQNTEDRLETVLRHLHLSEKLLQEKKQELDYKDLEMLELKEDLSNHQKALREVVNSRAWKTVMLYSRIKNGLMVKPAATIKKGWQILRYLGPKVFWQRLMRKILRTKPVSGPDSEYGKYIEQNCLLPATVKIIKKQIEQFDYKPLISIVMPVYNVEEKWLIRAIESVRNQIYDKWELCICDDASTAPHIKPLLERYAADGRIKIVFRQKNGGIVKASNEALKLARGAYVGLLDHDDELAPEALCEVVSTLQETLYDLIYSDEDKIDREDVRCEPFFKPDWSPDLLLSCNYVSHFGVYRRKIIESIGGFREGFDGSQDYDLVLRFTEKTQMIKHVPRILYHWRKIPGSAAASVEAKPYAYESAKKALADAMKRRKIEGKITDGKWKGSYRIKRDIAGTPLISVIIPFKDQKEALKKCIESIIAKSTYKNYEIILVNNGSELTETMQYLESVSGKNRISLLNYDAPFNYSAINNFAVGQAEGEYVILLNNDTEVITPDWMETMLEHAQRNEVGAVGIKLLYPNDTIQHAGVLLGLGGLAGHAFCRLPAAENGSFGLADVIRDYSSVTAACMMVKKSVYVGCGGFNEQQLAIAFNDVDFCLRLREQGYLIVYTPYAALYHHESLSRGFEVNVREIEYVQRRHGGLLHDGDPYYNKNLTLERSDFSLRCMDKVK
jgi:O-antigen biosynthesis protein